MAGQEERGILHGEPHMAHFLKNNNNNNNTQRRSQ